MDKERIVSLACSAKERKNLETYDCTGSCEDPDCGDVLCYYMKIVYEVVSEISFTIPESSCIPSKACAEMAARLAEGKPVLAAYLITADQIAEAVGGLEKGSYHCAQMAELALKRAILSHAAQLTQA